MAAVAALDQVLSGLPENFLTQQPDTLARTRASLDFLRERLSDPAVAMVSETTLNNFNAWLQGAASELQSAGVQNAPAQIGPNSGFFSNLEAISQNIGQLPVGEPTEKLNTLVEEGNQRLK